MNFIWLTSTRIIDARCPEEAAAASRTMECVIKELCDNSVLETGLIQNRLPVPAHQVRFWRNTVVKIESLHRLSLLDAKLD